MGLKHWLWRIFYLYSGLIVLFVGAIALVVTAYAPSRESLLPGVWLLAAVAIAVGLALTWYCVSQIATPLVDLAESLRVGAAGDEESPVALDTRDEAVVLSAAFQQLQRRLDRRSGQVYDNTIRLQTMLGSMIEGVLAVGPDKTILLANEAGRQMLDFATAEPVGRSLLEVTRARPVYEAVEQSLASNLPVEREFEAPGRRRTLALRATRLPAESSPGVMIVLHDVSELRRLENLRRELVANVSHELKTPLSAIKAYAETLRMGAINDSDNNLAFVARIEEQAERLHQLILDMLQIARIESGQATFEIASVSLRNALQQCLAQFHDMAAARRVSLQIDLPPDSLTARGDEEGLRAILSNLTDNAIKYTPAGGSVHVRCLATEAIVTLEVQDTGIGIAEQHQARVFERFYRIDKARSRELGGTGLGLSIVKHLAQAFGGSVTLESQHRRGSTFRVQLPRGVDLPEETPPAIDAAAS